LSFAPNVARSNTMPRTLLLLPGLLCDYAVWKPQVDALSDSFRCEVAEYGSLNSITAMAEHVLATAPTETFALAGHSMGGRVAFEVMRLAPQRVERLALLDTSYPPLGAGPDGEHERSRRLALLEVARKKGMRTMGRAWATGMVHPSRLDTPLFETILDMIERNTPDMFAAQIAALLARPDAGPQLRRIERPTLVLCGREDTWSPLHRHEEIHAAIPQSRLVVIERCGHMSTMEKPVEVSNALRDWLE
jgi:pimeloyl-ACP methyl ester carboxylesterase